MSARATILVIPMPKSALCLQHNTNDNNTKGLRETFSKIAPSTTSLNISSFQETAAVFEENST